MADHKRPESMERITTPALAEQFIAEQVAAVRAQVGDKKVLLALSGGVDSSVVAALLIKAVGKQLTCVHVNHGLLRKGEPEQVVEVFRNQMDANLVYVDAVDRFLDKLAGVADPETKRKIIGAEFIRVFEEEAGNWRALSSWPRGTIYPDILKAAQSRPTITWAACRRTFSLRWWNRSSSSSKMKSAWWEKALGLPDSMVFRQPFPGPGLGVRCLGAITRDRLEAVRESDAILREEFAKHGLEGKVWQYFTVVPDFKSTGVRDNARTFDWPVILRAVNTVDAMTGHSGGCPLPPAAGDTARITSEVKGVNRVLLTLPRSPVEPLSGNDA